MRVTNYSPWNRRILASQRHRRPEHNNLTHGAAVMAALSEATAMIASNLATVITKGGIIAAEIARAGLGAKTAHVLGPPSQAYRFGCSQQAPSIR